MQSGKQGWSVWKSLKVHMRLCWKCKLHELQGMITWIYDMTVFGMLVKRLITVTRHCKWARWNPSWKLGCLWRPSLVKIHMPSQVLHKKEYNKLPTRKNVQWRCWSHFKSFFRCCKVFHHVAGRAQPLFNGEMCTTERHGRRSRYIHDQNFGKYIQPKYSSNIPGTTKVS